MCTMNENRAVRTVRLQGCTLYFKTAGPLPESVLAKAKTAV